MMIINLDEIFNDFERIMNDTINSGKHKVTVDGSNTHIKGYPIINDKTKFTITKKTANDKSVFLVEFSNDDHLTKKPIPGRNNMFETLEEAKKVIETIKGTVAVPKETLEVVYQD